MPAGLEQEPSAPLSFINPDFDQAGGSNIVMLVADSVGLAQTRSQSLVVLAQLGQHILGLDILGIVVQYALQPRDVANGPERGSAYLAYALGNRISHGEDLVGLFVQQQVVIAEVRSAQVPVEVLGLHIERKNVGQDSVHGP